MKGPWTSTLAWKAHELALASWAAHHWGWQPGDPDWPACLALLAASEDEGHTALRWSTAPDLWRRRFASSQPVPDFLLPPLDQWPEALFEQGWLVRKANDLVQTARNAHLENRLEAALRPRAEATALHANGGTSQQQAVAQAGKCPLMILVGGPGTGKTTTLLRLITTWRAEHPGLRVVVAAPTGRAAARARSSLSSLEDPPECLTVHRLLGMKPGLGDAWHGPSRPLPFDLVVVDEASMVDLRTAVSLSEALLPEAAVVLVGDPAQLPSVDAGSVLADILSHRSWSACVFRLTHRHRLSSTARSLARVFDLLETGRPGEEVADEFAALSSSGGDFQWIVTEEGTDPSARALEAWGDARGLELKTLDDRILLSPVHAGWGGIDALGASIDRSLGRVPGTLDHGTPWMIRRNLPHLNLSNGDRGLLQSCPSGLRFFTAGGPEAGWPFSLVSDDGHSAWAVSVHKSQGSEYKKVVLVLPPQDSPLLARELLYTGLTRARSQAVLVSSRQSLLWALSRSATRQSGWGQ